MDEILAAAMRFYGLDWMTMVFGLTGAYLLTARNKMGFVLNVMACICSLSVAIISEQMGFIAYNLVFIALMTRGFLNWNRVPATASA